MAASFDANDIESWYHGAVSRQEATDLLMSEKECGVFLVRDSFSMKGDYVLCVREDSKVNHYIINKVYQNDEIRYRIGDQFFTDLPSLLNFYRLHYLDTTPLIKAAPRRMEKVKAKYDFHGKDPDDLSFRKGEILIVLYKKEEHWWSARNSLGQEGLIPVPYIEQFEETVQFNNGMKNVIPNSSHPCMYEGSKIKKFERPLPAKAVVLKARVPNAYDSTALKLEVGDVILVTKMNMNGQWEGELNGKTGYFPFNHVELIDIDKCELICS